MSEKRKSAASRGYNSRWQKYRARYLQENPLCRFHLELGQSVAASVVDHIIPHHNDNKLFWDPSNHQPLCKPCHDRHKQRLEKGGVLSGCDVSGIPLDAGHHWRRPGGGKNL